jgi:Ecdysteroid kinase-like family
MEAGVAESLRGIESDWLDGALREGGHTGAKVVSVEIVPLAFTGATTDMARLQISYDEEGEPGPATLVAKMKGKDELRQQMDAVMGLFGREARFYSQIADRVPIRSPKAFYVGDGDTAPLLLEDLARMRLGDQNEGMSLEDAENVLDVLADMHAAFWESDELSEDWLARPYAGELKGLIANLMLTGLPKLTERYSEQFPDVIAQVPTDPEGWGRILEHFAEGPHTLAHNDCRLDNMFFDDDGTPVFVDWQFLSDSRGSQDVGNLLGGSMEADDLSKNWESLLRRYHDRLVEKGVSGYSFDDCVLHYRQHVVWALGQGMSLLGALGDERSVGDALVLRALPHIAELDSFEALKD